MSARVSCVSFSSPLRLGDAGHEPVSQSSSRQSSRRSSFVTTHSLPIPALPSLLESQSRRSSSKQHEEGVPQDDMDLLASARQEMEFAGVSDDKEECGHQFILRETSTIRRSWNMVTAFLLWYTSTLFPFRLCFLEFRIPEPAPENSVWLVFETLVDMLFCIDFVSHFFFTYQDSCGNEVTSLRRIAIKYFRGSFWINFVSCIPHQALRQLMLWISTNDRDVAFNKAARLVRLHRVSRIARLTQMLRFVQAFPCLGGSHFCRRLSGMRGVRAINFVLGLLWVVHLVACGWYLCAAMHHDPEETWVGRRVIDSKGTTLYDVGPMGQWFQAMYFVLTVFTTVGFGDMAAVTTGEVIYVFFAMIVGTVAHSVIVGKMINAVTWVDQQAVHLSKQKELIEAFADHTQLSSTQVEQLMFWIGATRTVRRGFDRDQVRCLLTDATLPRAVIGQLPRGVFGGRLLKNRFLTNLHPQVQLPATLPLLIALAVNQRYVSPREVMYYCYDHPESLFLVLEGVFANVAKPDVCGGLAELPPSVGRLFRISEQFSNASTVALHPYQLFCFGNYFGEAELLLDSAIRRSCARCESEDGGLLLVLNKHDLFPLMEEFPRFREAWLCGARRREAYRKDLLGKLTHGRSFRHLAASSIQRCVCRRLLRHSNRNVRKKSNSSSFLSPQYVPRLQVGEYTEKEDTESQQAPAEIAYATREDLDSLKRQILEVLPPVAPATREDVDSLSQRLAEVQEMMQIMQKSVAQAVEMCKATAGSSASSSTAIFNQTQHTRRTSTSQPHQPASTQHVCESAINGSCLTATGHSNEAIAGGSCAIEFEDTHTPVQLS